jgi:DNA-binding winged helix-turn-helix (wHTH) protein/TolB-like protein
MSEDSQAFPEILEFEGYELDPLHRVLSRDGEVVQVTGKALDCLIALISERERVVTRAELMDAVWAETYVEESNLTQNISVLRRALGEGARDHRFIVTVPGRGYRFVASVRTLEDSKDRAPDAATATTSSNPATESGDSRPDFGSRRALIFAALWLVSLLLLSWWLSNRNEIASSPSATFPTSPADQIRSLAVLPFVSLGQDTSDSELLGLGMADALITRLSRVHSLSIRPTSSILRWKDLGLDSVEVGSALGVDAILTGTLQRSDNRVRVTTQLTRVSDRATIWAGTFERDFTGIFAQG